MNYCWSYAANVYWPACLVGSVAVFARRPPIQLHSNDVHSSAHLVCMNVEVHLICDGSTLGTQGCTSTCSICITIYVDYNTV